jgi:hypothetical protein
MSITAQQRRLVRQRAGNCCEYCRLPESAGTVTFHVDHIIPVKHDGEDDTDNLCLACYHCNGYKGADIAGFDPVTRDLTRLYHPREQVWNDHFRLEEGAVIVGLTPEGRTTARVLRFNEDSRLRRRRILMRVGLYPCPQEG